MQQIFETRSAKLAAKDFNFKAASPRQKTSTIWAPSSLTKKRLSAKLEETPNSISISWRSIRDHPPRVQLSVIRKTFKAAVAKHKKTVTIDNIAIYDAYDVKSAAKVLNAKKEVETAVRKSTNSLLGLDIINRLFLESDRFGVRYYLDKEHPTDYVYQECER